MDVALTVAGSDSSGGAGIQADVKTMIANGVYAESVITSLTAQNTTGVFGVFEVPADFVAAQLDAVFSDIRPVAVKTGMLGSPALIEAVCEGFKRHGAQNIVVDPVMVSTSGSRLLPEEGVRALCKNLLPLATLVTPNIPEAEIISGIEIGCEKDMLAAAKKINAEAGCAVLVKGGHSADNADDVLVFGGKIKIFRGERVNNPNSHGTGCTLSAAICANLAKGFSLVQSVARAKQFVKAALSAGLDLGKGAGPLNHAFSINGKFARRAQK